MAEGQAWCVLASHWRAGRPEGILHAWVEEGKNPEDAGTRPTRESRLVHLPPGPIFKYPNRGDFCLPSEAIGGLWRCYFRELSYGLASETAHGSYSSISAWLVNKHPHQNTSAGI